MNELKENSPGASGENEIPGRIFLGKCLAFAVSTKNNSIDEQEYQEGVVAPYMELKRKYDEVNLEFSKDDRDDALALVKKIFTNKKVAEEESQQRISRLLELFQSLE